MPKHSDDDIAIITFADKCQTHEQWLKIVRSAMPTLLKKPELLLELIMREALQEDGREDMNAKTREIFPEAQKILQELRLTFVPLEEED